MTTIQIKNYTVNASILIALFFVFSNLFFVAFAQLNSENISTNHKEIIEHQKNILSKNEKIDANNETEISHIVSIVDNSLGVLSTDR